MSKIKVRILVTGFLIGAAICYGADFRGSNWGDSLDQVRAVEGPAEIAYTIYGLPMLGYTVTLGAYNTEAVFYFTAENELAVGKYFAYETGIDVFNAWRGTLVDKYGSATNRDTLYTTNEYILEKNYYGAAPRELENGVEYGYFTLCVSWQTDTTIINLELEKFEGDVNTILGYISKELAIKFLKEQSEGGKAGF